MDNIRSSLVFVIGGLWLVIVGVLSWLFGAAESDVASAIPVVLIMITTVGWGVVLRSADDRWPLFFWSVGLGASIFTVISTAAFVAEMNPDSAYPQIVFLEGLVAFAVLLLVGLALGAVGRTIGTHVGSK